MSARTTHGRPIIPIHEDNDLEASPFDCLVMLVINERDVILQHKQNQ